MADGILTPAVSVTSSVGGLAVVAPVVGENVRPISIAFLLVLFLGQRFGTQKLSFLFAPCEYDSRAPLYANVQCPNLPYCVLVNSDIDLVCAPSRVRVSDRMITGDIL
jgi:hypothetical protein